MLKQTELLHIILYVNLPEAFGKEDSMFTKYYVHYAHQAWYWMYIVVLSAVLIT